MNLNKPVVGDIKVAPHPSELLRGKAGKNTPDHYETIGKIPTREDAGTSFWSPDLNRYYVAAHASDKEPATIRGVCASGLQSPATAECTI
jgi:hypothetical protein